MLAMEKIRVLLADKTEDESVKVLHAFLETGLINRDDYTSLTYELFRKQVLTNHPYTIYQQPDGRWRTYFKPPGGKRKIIVKTKLPDLESALVTYYKGIEKEEVPTFLNTYWKWRELKDLQIEDGTRRKHDTDFIRFFQDEEFVNRPLCQITEAEIERFIFKKVQELSLCKSALKTLVCIVKGVFRFAYKNKMILEDPASDIQRSTFYKQCKEKDRPLDTVLISDHDWSLLYERLLKDFEEMPTYMAPYAILFAAFTGVRVGELSVLKWEDIRQDPISGMKYLLINRSESYNPVNHTYSIRDVKNHKDRTYPITPQIQDLLDLLEKVQTEHNIKSEWLFPDEVEEHIHKNPIRDCLRNRCRMVGITERGTHALRRTLNSDLRTNGVSSVMASSLIGNSTFVNEKHYTFDVSNLEEKERIIESVNKKRIEKAMTA